MPKRKSVIDYHSRYHFEFTSSTLMIYDGTHLTFKRGAGVLMDWHEVFPTVPFSQVTGFDAYFRYDIVFIVHRSPPDPKSTPRSARLRSFARLASSASSSVLFTAIRTAVTRYNTELTIVSSTGQLAAD